MTGHHHGDAGDTSPTDRRGRLLLAVVLVPALLATMVGLLLLWPSERTRAADADQFVPDAIVAARIVEVREVDCGSVEVEGRCQQVTAELADGSRQQLEVDPGAGQPRLVVGDDVQLARYVDVVGLETFALVDYQRDRPLLLLGLLTAVVVVAVARWRGLAAIAGVAITGVGVVVFVLPAILEGSSPVAVALTASSALLFVVLYLAHGLSARTSAALVGTLISLGLCAALSALAVDLTRITGLSSEETVALQGFASGVDVRELLLCGFVIGALGVLNDVTITQASAVWELRASDPTSSRLAVYGRAMRIGRDHIASSVYTLVFAYAGAALPLLLVFTLLDRPVGQVLTGDLIAVELVRTAVGTIGLVLSVPITTAVAAFVAGSRPVPTRSVSGGSGVGHDVVAVVAGATVERPAAGDQAQAGIGGRGVDVLGGEGALVVPLHALDHEDGTTTVRAEDLDPVVDLQVADPLEDAGLAVEIGMPDQHGGTGVAGQGPVGPEPG